MGFTGVISSNLSACTAIRCSKPSTRLPIGSCWGGGDSAHHWLLNLEPFWGLTCIVHAPCRPTILCLNQNIFLQKHLLALFSVCFEPVDSLSFCLQLPKNSTAKLNMYVSKTAQSRAAIVCFSQKLPCIYFSCQEKKSIKWFPILKFNSRLFTPFFIKIRVDQIFQRSALTNIILYYYIVLFLMAKKASDVPTKWEKKSNDETIFPWGEKRQH